MPEQIDYPEDLGLDYREPAIAAPAMPGPAPMPVAAPGATAVTAPGGFLSREEADQRAVMRRLQYGIADLPLAEAEQAVSTALKFQAVRGYQKDLQEGKSASEALARWAPIMFTQPKAATLGQAASLIRAQAPTEKYMDIGGVGYMMKGGKATPLTTKVTPPKPVPLQMPVNPDDPFGGHLTIPLEPTDPLVKSTIERARKGPTPPPPEPPGFFSRLFGTKPAAQAPAPAQAPAVAPARVPTPAPAPAVVPTPRPVIGKPSTPGEKLAAARELRKLHPDWSKQRILDEVNR